jgi:hypothetical protein
METCRKPIGDLGDYVSSYSVSYTIVLGKPTKGRRGIYTENNVS